MSLRLKYIAPIFFQFFLFSISEAGLQNSISPQSISPKKIYLSMTYQECMDLCAKSRNPQCWDVCHFLPNNQDESSYEVFAALSYSKCVSNFAQYDKDDLNYCESQLDGIDKYAASLIRSSKQAANSCKENDSISCFFENLKEVLNLLSARKVQLTEKVSQDKNP